MTATAEIRVLLSEVDEQIAGLQVDVAELQHLLDECQEGTPPPPPPPPTGKTLWGGSARAPSATNTPVELMAYRGKTQGQMVDILNAEQAALVGKTGLIWDAFHGYVAGVPTSLAATEAKVALDRNLIAVLNISADAAQIASGSKDADIKKLVESCPEDRPTYLVIQHEPSNDNDWKADPPVVAARWRKAVAHFSAKVIEYRGTRPVTPTICVINWDLSPKNADTANRDLQNPRVELMAEGVNLDDVLYTTDGYDTKTVSADGAADLYTDAANGRPGVADLVRSWGFQRFGVSEGSCKSHTAPNRALADDWIARLGEIAASHNFEYYLWFNSGNGERAGAEGWYIYGDAAKKAFAEIITR